MKRNTTIFIVVLVMLGLYAVSSYNGMVSRDEDVNEKWAQVQNVYQRRMDLIPNLVNTVKGYAAHEKETLEAVINARASATKITPEALQGALNNPQAFQNFEAAQSAMSSALSKLMVVVERYPELKANENFLALQSQLEGTENRITVERKRFSEAVRDFNKLVRRFPERFVAQIFGFEKKAMFEASAGAEKAPEVKF